MSVRGVIAKVDKKTAVVSTGGLSLAGFGLEMFRWYTQASDKADQTLGVAFQSAVQAGKLERQLDACLDQQELLMEVARQCVQ